MSLSIIVIGADTYNSYASLAEADSYLAVDPTRAATWDALTDDQKGAKLVSATRRLDLLTWMGEKTGGDPQVNKFPRTGVTYPSGGAVSTSEVPVDVQNATALLAGSITMDAEVSSAGGSNNDIRKVGAGKASVEFFKSQEDVPMQDETAYSLVKSYLGSTVLSSALGMMVSGNEGLSIYTDIDAMGLTSGFL